MRQLCPSCPCFAFLTVFVYIRALVLILMFRCHVAVSQKNFINLIESHQLFSVYVTCKRLIKDNCTRATILHAYYNDLNNFLLLFLSFIFVPANRRFSTDKTKFVRMHVHLFHLMLAKLTWLILFLYCLLNFASYCSEQLYIALKYSILFKTNKQNLIYQIYMYDVHCASLACASFA